MTGVGRRLSTAITICVVFLSVYPSTGDLRGDTARRPNVVLVMTDDQGYGDLGCHGNPVIRTPNLDRLHRESVRLTDFHVDPTCSPTRAALMTGRYSSRSGVWHTIAGRSLLRRDETTLADHFRRAGYRTGIFGKWHLGDNYPFRVQDRGWQDSLVLGGGGVGQTPDSWGNSYFDDTFWRNGVPEKQSGYCTDVFFRAALRFIEQNRHRPFLCYLATNAPHGPYRVAERYAARYRKLGVSGPRAAFYGMIENIDDNVGRLLRALEEHKLADNTVVLFLTDNGTAAGWTEAKRDGFNAGMRGVKGSAYEGGHRVPCFWRWPGRLSAGRDVADLAAHLDVLPTLLDLCGIEAKHPLPLDGLSLRPVLTGTGKLPARTLFVHSQRIEHPQKWRQCAVLTPRWRLIDGKQLYDLPADPGQRRDVAADHPDVVRHLRGDYEQWYASISTRFGEYCPIVLGADAENPALLTAHDWHADDLPWDQTQVRRLPRANGFWAVQIDRAGRYRFTLRHQPAEANCPLRATSARVQLGAATARIAVPAGATAVSLDLTLAPGDGRLQTWLDEADATSRGAFYVEVRRLP
ncbi:MAG: arylsulfatase [Gemmataceae bacterium]